MKAGNTVSMDGVLVSSKELLEAFDENGNSLGVMLRETAEAQNHTTKNALVFLFDSFGDVWIQLRAKTKKHYPGQWDITACGGSNDNEDSMQAALRELEEETGLSGIQLEHVNTFLNIFPGDKGEERRRMSSLYVGYTDLIPQPVPGETDEFTKCKPDELLMNIIQNPGNYVPSFEVELRMALEFIKKSTQEVDV